MIENGDRKRMSVTHIDRRQYTRLLGIFVRATREDIERTRTALDAGQAEIVAEVAHHIRGAADGLELGEIAYNARFIEEHVGRRDRWDELRSLSDEIDRQLSSIANQFGIEEG